MSRHSHHEAHGWHLHPQLADDTHLAIAREHARAAPGMEGRVARAPEFELHRAVDGLDDFKQVHAIGDTGQRHAAASAAGGADDTGRPRRYS